MRAPPSMQRKSLRLSSWMAHASPARSMLSTVTRFIIFFIDMEHTTFLLARTRLFLKGRPRVQFRKSKGMQADDMLLDGELTEGSVHVRGRKRTWQRNWEARAAADVTVTAMAALFGLRQSEAARTLGVSLSTLQRICRRLGIGRWPSSWRTPRPTRAAAEAAAQGFFA